MERPHVVLNVAITVDGKTDTIARRGARISSKLDLERVDGLRADADAIMVGGRTLLGDDPKLTVRSPALRAERVLRGLERNPIKVGVVSNAALRRTSRFLAAGPAGLIIATTRRTSEDDVARLRQLGAQVWVLGERAVDLTATLARLHVEGIRRLMVEGGGTLNASLLRAGLVDEIYVYVAAFLLGGATSPTFVDGPGWRADEAVSLELLEAGRLGPDGLLLHYRVAMA